MGIQQTIERLDDVIDTLKEININNGENLIHTSIFTSLEVVLATLEILAYEHATGRTS